MKKLYRSRSNRLLSGVCGGLADYFNMDPTILRLIYVLLTVGTVFSGVIVYIIMMIIVPEERNPKF